MPIFQLATPQAPVRKNIKHRKGNDFLYKVTAQNEDGSPYDFTGHTFRAQVRLYPASSIISVDIPNASFTITQDADGLAAGRSNVFKITHTKADFLMLKLLEYFYDIEITDAAGLVFTPIVGTIQIMSDVTR